MSKSKRQRYVRPVRDMEPFVEQSELSRSKGDTHFKNNAYAVVAHDHGVAILLTIMPLNGRINMQNLNDLQIIKAELGGGADREAIQIFPSSKRPAHPSTAFRLWVLKPGSTIPTFFYADSGRKTP